MRTSALRPVGWTFTLTIAGLLSGFCLLSRIAAAAPGDDLDRATLQSSSGHPDAGTWTSETAFPLAGVVRAWGVYFPANGKYYVLGGRQSDAAGSEILSPREYYPLGQTWATKATSFPDNQVNNLLGGVLNVAGTDYIVLVGGSAAGATTATSAVRAHEPILDAGVTLTSDPWPGNVGGTVLPGGGVLSDTTYAYLCDPDLDSIAAIAPVPRPVGETRAVTQRDGKIWLLGGGRTSPNPAAQVDVYDPAMNSWSLGSPMRTARRNFAADVIPGTGEVIAVGGYAPTNPTNVTENWSALIFNNGFELGALCFWNNTADTYYVATNSGAAIVPGVNDTGNHADDGSTVISLPFPYQLYDYVFNSVAVGSNGRLTFGSVYDGSSPSCIPVADPSYVIAPYWSDQCTTACLDTACSGSGIFTSTTGTAPHRIFNVEYRTRYYNSGGDGAPGKRHFSGPGICR